MADESVVEQSATLPALARGCALLVVGISAWVMLGWVLQIEAMAQILPGAVTVKANACLGFAALAGGALASRRRLMDVAALVSAALGSVTLLEYLIGADLGIDQAVLVDHWRQVGAIPGRMSGGGALCLVLVALAVLLLGRVDRRWVQVPLVVAMVVCVLTVLGHLYGAVALYRLVLYSSMAPPTAICLMLLVVAVTARVPGSMLAWAVRGAGPGPALVRVMAPVALVGFPIAGGLRLAGELLGLYEMRFGLAMMVVMTAGMLLAVTFVSARRLDTTDSARVAALRELESANAELTALQEAERRRVEDLTQSLAEERAKFASAVSALEDLVFTLQVEDGDVRLVYSNAHLAGVFGVDLAPGTDVVRLFLDSVVEEDRDAVDEFAEAVLDGRAAELEVAMNTPNGARQWLWVRGFAREHADCRYFDGIVTNVTERHRLAAEREELLEREQETVRQLQELEQMRREFLAVTGHELKTPLAAIRAYAEVLAEDSDLTRVQRHQVEVITRRSEQVSELVDNFFDLAKLQAGLTELSPRRVQLDELIAEVVQGHARAAKEEGLRLRMVVEPVSIEADPVRLRQVLDNLLSNAVKYSNPGGIVEVSSRVEGTPPAYVDICVADQGIGIPEEERHKVFDRMFRASSARRAGVAGTGLGLAVTRGLVEAHGGTIVVRANEPRGTRFGVRLPLQDRGAIA